MTAKKHLIVKRSLPLTQANCRRCTEPFRYFRRGRHRYYCEPCRDIQRQEANDHHNAEAKQARLEARENAKLAHEAITSRQEAA